MSSKQTERKGQQAGFSLLELMVTVAVLAIIVGIAAPSFNSMMQRSRLSASSNEILAVLQSARMEALRANAKVEVCPSIDGVSCGGSDWKRVIVAVEKNGTTTVLRNVSNDTPGIDILSSDAISSNKIWYLPDGFVRMGDDNAPVQVGALRVCTTGLSAENARDIRLNMGRVSISRVTNASCEAPGNS